MVIDNKTLKPLHELTKEGEERYHNYLEKKADDILFKAQKPFRYMLYKFSEKIDEIKEGIKTIKETIIYAIQAYLDL